MSVSSPISYPGHNILTEDIGMLIGIDDCKCEEKENILRYFVECLSQKSEGVVMFIKIKAINFIAGSKRIQEGSDKIFDEKIIDFLNTVSIQIANKKSKNYPDLITFGFWQEIEYNKIKKDYKLTKVSRGIVLHICPSNVPMNFAFSMVFGLLSGNSNIIRLPSIEYQQVKEFCNIIKKIIKIKKFSFIKNKLCLISYKKSDEISSALSKLSDARMLWGGDETIQNLRNILQNHDVLI